jgi:glycosyltransferase involved in cell wall biosynthesis
MPRWEGRISRLKMACRRRLGLYESPLSKYLRTNKIDAVFGGLEFGPDFRVPLLTWIADFQHVHLPDMFPPSELADRDERFGKLAQYANRIIVSSHDALADLQRFAPAQAQKGRVASFVSLVPEFAFDGDPGAVCRDYALPERFFYLPNQFWKHKNHEVVVRALCRVKERCPELTVVCTGNTNDYRNPGYFGWLLGEFSRAGVRDRMIILGTVPHADVFRLLRQSIGVLQPSLFEGWNTAVEECKSMGKAMIVSDIAVHREQNPPHSLYFPPTDEAALADCLCQAYAEWKPGPDVQMEAEARRNLPLRMKAFAQTFMDAINEAVS